MKSPTSGQIIGASSSMDATTFDPNHMTLYPGRFLMHQGPLAYDPAFAPAADQREEEYEGFHGEQSDAESSKNSDESKKKSKSTLGDQHVR